VIVLTLSITPLTSWGVAYGFGVVIRVMERELG
jgi:hypothetical protein